MDINELRALLGKRTTAATKKISRIKTSQGAIISGTDFDIRTNRKNIKRLNRKQLEVALDRTNKFLSRKTQYVGLADKSPVTRTDWVTFQKNREKQNEVANAVYNKVKALKHPTQDTTIGQAREQRIPTSHPSAGNPSVNIDFGAPKLEPKGVVSREAFEKLSKDAKRKSSPEFMDKAIKGARENFDLISSGGHVHMNDRIKKLSNEKFMALWNIKEFVDAQSLIYQTMKSIGFDLNNASQTQLDVMDTGREEMNTFVTWAENLKLGK